MIDLVADFDFILFAIIAFGTLISAILVLEAKDLTHAIIMLAMAFVGISAIYLLLTAEYIAMIQMTVFAGGVIVLFLFAIMLTRSEEFMVRGSLNRTTNALFAIILIIIFTVLIIPISTAYVGSINPQGVISDYPHGIALFGFSLFNIYQTGFLILGLIIISALLGAIYLVKNEPEDEETEATTKTTTEDTLT